ncbi:hypothetical protein [Actinoplanes subglobosus]|uniref:Uncharacterized protein n=1 Tax=Actinoplanes subglobosus TaxID=1547892 RepID=A0ABV8J963_9ACTN
MSTWEEEFSPSAATQRVLAWALRMGAATLGEAYDMLDHFEESNDVPEVLGEDDTIEEVREDIEFGLDTTGPDTELTSLL